MLLANEDFQYRDSYFIVGSPVLPLIFIVILIAIGISIFMLLKARKK